MLKKIPILTFHSVDTSGSVISFHPSSFENLLRELQRKHYTTLLLSDVVDWLDGRKKLSGPCVVITFDDGFDNLYTTVFPLLQACGFKATLFLTTGYCGKKNNWPAQPAEIPRLPMLRWTQVKELAETVFEIQPHTQTHPYLPRLNIATGLEEIRQSKLEIEDRLGKPARFFSYPYGDHNDGVYNLVREYFDGACSTTLGFVRSASDKYLLERIDMCYFTNKFYRGFFASPLEAPYLVLRKWLRKFRASWQRS